MESPVALLLLLLLCLGALAPTPGSASSEAPPLVNEDVKRTVDLSSHLAKVTAEVVLVHPGGGSTSRASSFVLALEPELESRLAHLGVQIKGEDEEDNNLEVRETKIKGKSGRFFTVKLPVALDPGSKISVVVETVYTHVLHPYPTQITQSEKQFVVFEGNHYFYSPYPTKTQTMRVKLASRNVESYEYLYNLGDQYALKMRFVDHVFDEQVIDSLTVKIILPEGAKNIQVDSPYDISRAPDELHYTYLDTFGRPVIVAYKKNLVEQHIQDIVVHYTFNKVLMLQEPLLVVAAFYILFFTVIIYVRLDFSITKDPAAEARMKVACITEQVLTLVNKRLGLYRHFDETVNRYKQSRDISTLNSGKKSLETEHKAVTSEIAVLQSRLKTEGSDLCDRVSEMQKLDAQVKELVLKSAVEAERLVAGKLKKDTYLCFEHRRFSS